MEIFNCPFSDCAFNRKKNFKKRILLDQHLLNCHSEKRFKCPNCFKQYAIEWQLKYHLKGCGLNFTCLTCNKTYKERLSLITHCKRNSHQMPENARLLKKETQKNLFILPYLENNYLIKRKESKFRPILPKSINTNLIINQNKSLELNQNLLNNQINHSNKSNQLQNNTLIDNYCQTDNLCQCSQTNSNNQTLKKTANTLSVQCPEIDNYSNLRREIRSSIQSQNHKSLEYSDSHTQTDNSSFTVNNQLFKDQSTSTEINSDDFLNLKRKSVAIETNLNNLNKNYCFFNFEQQNLLNDQFDSQFNECNRFKNNLNSNSFDNQLTELTGISSELNKVQLNEETNKDPLLSTISVQTDLEYDNLNDYLLNNDLDIQFNDIQTQTYFTDFNHNATQTEDFSLDIDNIFDN